MITPTRRGFLLGLGAALVAAPAIVKASSIMPIKVPKLIVPAAPALETAYILGDDALFVSPAMMAQLKREVSKLALFPARGPSMDREHLKYCGIDVYVAPPVLTRLVGERPHHPRVRTIEVGARDGQLFSLGDAHDAIAALKA